MKSKDDLIQKWQNEIDIETAKRDASSDKLYRHSRECYIIQLYQCIEDLKQLNEETREVSVKVCQCYRSTPDIDANGETYCKKCGLKA